MLLFSDLHLSVKTYETSMKVLRHVHQQAKEHNVAVGFLGDFFDHVYNKGTLPVNILNSLMRFFASEWSVPMVMIPGNHDYFDASETEHGLTPFEYASDYITVLNEPTVVNRQLWIPWRRCNQTLENILQEHQDVDVIFGHFDIVGFKLNPTKVSTEGLVGSTFPTDKPIYTGHYHTPQVQKNIRYLGSPYQLTLSEAEDNKALVLIDTSGWQVKQLLPLNIGPKQFKWSVDELKERHSILHANDRVVVAVTEEGLSPEIISDLELRGVNVTVKKKLVHQTSTRLEHQDALSPQQLFQNYGQRFETIDQQSGAWQLVEQWIESTPPTLVPTSRDVRPEKLELSGFGPFKGQVTLALDSQGFTLISGECNDSKNASNGAGKSMLAAGAWLWACTGMIDGRGTLSFGGTVLHTAAEKARVTVSGTVEGHAWSITRSICERKHTVQLTMDNKDCTRATISATQKAIASDLFGLDLTAGTLHAWLLRNSVWSQMSVPRWLDANDTQAKKEICPYANMGCWVTLHDKAKNEQKITTSTVQELTHQTNLKQQQHDSAQQFHTKQLQDIHTWEMEKLKLVQTASSRLEAAQRQASGQTLPVKPLPIAPITQLRSKMEQKRTQLARARVRHELIPKNTAPLSPLLPINRQSYDHCIAEKYKAEHLLKQYQRELQHFIISGECATCHRPFDIENAQQGFLEQQIQDGQVQLALVQQAAEKAKVQYETAVRVGTQHTNAAAIMALQDEIETLTACCASEQQQLNHAEQHVIKENVYQLSKEKYDRCQHDVHVALQQLDNAKQLSCPMQNTLAELADTIQQLQVEVTQLTIQKTKAEQFLQTLKTAASWMGPRGIQTYAMECAVQKLAALTTVWLRRFFKIDNIELRAHFDEKERLIRQVVCPTHDGIMSGGQWRRAQLASFMAWREMSQNSFPLLVMDEACTSMDQDGISSVQDTLKEWCEENDRRTCLFITHDSSQHRDTSVYQNHVRIIHKRGRSSLVDQGEQSKKPRHGLFSS